MFYNNTMSCMPRYQQGQYSMPEMSTSQRPSGSMPMQPQTPHVPGMPPNGAMPQVPPFNGGMIPQVPAPGQLPLEMSYVENILRLNRGKIARVYMTFEGRSEDKVKVFEGIIEAAGRDHIIISDPQTGRRYLLLMVYLDYVEFDEEIEYDYPFNGNVPIQMNR